MPSSDNAEIVRRFVHEVLNAGDAAAVEALVAPDYRAHGALQDLSDRTSLITWLSDFRLTFPDAQWSIEDMVCQDDRVAVRLLFTGTQSGGLQGQPPVSVNEIHFFRLEDGLLAEHWSGTHDLQTLRSATMFRLRGHSTASTTLPEGRQVNERFDKFTERARKVLTLAQEEATRFNHNYIGTEHLLLGLLREGDGVAAKVLASLGVELNRVRSAVEFIIGRGDRMIMGEIGLTPRAKKVIELAVDEARRLGHHYIGTEHLLLGLVREGEGIAAGVLESVGVSLDKVRTQTIQVLSASSGSFGVSQPVAAAEEGMAPPATPTVRWVYLRLRVTAPDGQNEGTVDAVLGDAGAIEIAAGTPIGAALNALGTAGWELAGIDRGTASPNGPAFYVFKRQVAG